MTGAASLLDCLAIGYRLDLGGAEYVTQLAEAAAPLLDRGLGVIAYTYDARDPARPVIDHVAVTERFDPSWLPAFDAAVEAASLDVGSPTHPTGFHVWQHLLCGQASAVPGMHPFLPLFAHLGGARDAFAVNALDASGRGLWLAAPLPSTELEPSEQITLFTRFATHLTAALRLRRSASMPPAGILAPDGALLHAEEGEEGVIEAREELRRATLAFEQARTKELRSDVDRATRHWRPLVASRWSLLDDFDTDGRRFVVAVANPSPTRPPRNDLSEREHQVLTQAHLGHSTKVIAYELGLSDATVRVLLHRAARKLGVATREEALARFEVLAAEHDDEEPDSEG
ncbi:MAG: helix-turn-helix transcriptional regulator [Polyangiaceae bacterium]|nr:helix-turn-helix transcriptional regulator [Polyangiaceae bacterium]MCW5791258.1 helix-turn-helix transcriptional regulator [Polyangiaceae bacterium]